ncbi:MAG: nucleotidyltransferase domain-containing protein, partial [Verrucomicrobiota bacterium]|nr:nucleotidyltransferase domain-containing protein [Verrucomicrobiota bacterium]
MSDKNIILEYLKKKKDVFKKEYGITELGLYGSYARDEATENSDVDIFYERDKYFKLKS